MVLTAYSRGSFQPPAALPAQSRDGVHLHYTPPSIRSGQSQVYHATQSCVSMSIYTIRHHRFGRVGRKHTMPHRAAYRWRSPQRVRLHRASSPQGTVAPETFGRYLFRKPQGPSHVRASFYHTVYSIQLILLLLNYGNLLCQYRSTPVAQLAPRNLLTRWDVSSIPANGIFLTKN